MKLTSLRGALLSLSIVIVAFLVAASCTLGGKEGDRCNPLVLRDECNSGLSCKAASCTESYCCPTNGSSSDPHCNAEGCPDENAGNEGGSEAGEDTGADSAEAGQDAGADG